MTAPTPPDLIEPVAAVDLGSNSFRLELGSFRAGQYQRTHYLKETVRLGNGLDAQHCLTPDAMQRGWDCLARFAPHLQGLAPPQIQAVATQTLREARNRDDFLRIGSRLLGHPIRIISGEEEARLIFEGVAHTLNRDDELRLVVDIGGRSTELILGQGGCPHQLASCAVGSVSWSMRFFPDGLFTPQAFATAEHAARAVLAQPGLPSARDAAWVCYGSAGTINAAVDALHASGWTVDTLTHQGLIWLRQQLIDAGDLRHLKLPGLREDRKPIMAGGLSILCALFDLLGMEQLTPCSGGLRHGLLMQSIKKA